MKDETKKSYNPFKMWGSWVGVSLVILAIFNIPVINLNPIWWFIDFCNNATDQYFCRLNVGIIAGVTLPVILFLLGWGVHSICRKFASK